MTARSRLPVSSQERHTDIIAKLEGASGPDRELDALIWCELIENADVYWWDRILMARDRSGEREEWRVGTIDPGKVARNFSVAWSAKPIPFYTASLDAALALVEEKLPGWWWEIRYYMRGPDTRGFLVTTYPDGGDGEPVAETGPTAPLAVLLALFKALEAQ